MEIKEIRYKGKVYSLLNLKPEDIRFKIVLACNQNTVCSVTGQQLEFEPGTGFFLQGDLGFPVSALVANAVGFTCDFGELQKIGACVQYVMLINWQQNSGAGHLN